jgi:phosphatidylinositol-3-phosphatase
VRKKSLYLTIAAVSLACSAYSLTPKQPSSGADATTRSPARTAARIAASAAPNQPVTKLLVVVVENHSLAQMRNQMPYTAALAGTFGYATNYHGVDYPSLPNYIAITSGSTHGINDDGPPAEHPLGGSSVFGQAIAHGKTAAVYADGMQANCAPQRGGNDYAVKHNPWAYYQDEQDLCQANDVPATRLDDAAAQGNLPNAGMLVPNLCHDAHDCNLSVADDWIKSELTNVFAGPDWQSGHLAVVITADTDDRSDNNTVLTVVAHPSQQGNVVDQRLDHYSLSRLYSDVLNAPPLNRAASANSMSDAFGLPLN